MLQTIIEIPEMQDSASKRLPTGVSSGFQGQLVGERA